MNDVPDVPDAQLGSLPPSTQELPRGRSLRLATSAAITHPHLPPQMQKSVPPSDRHNRYHQTAPQITRRTYLLPLQSATFAKRGPTRMRGLHLAHELPTLPRPP